MLFLCMCFISNPIFADSDHGKSRVSSKVDHWKTVARSQMWARQGERSRLSRWKSRRVRQTADNVETQRSRGKWLQRTIKVRPVANQPTNWWLSFLRLVSCSYFSLNLFVRYFTLNFVWSTSICQVTWQILQEHLCLTGSCHFIYEWLLCLTDVSYCVTNMTLWFCFMFLHVGVSRENIEHKTRAYRPGE